MIQLISDKLERQQKGLDLVSNFGRPIPGQSLTNSPDQAYAWEKPAQFSTVKQCLIYIYDNLLEEDAFDNLTTALSREVPIFDIASAILYTGFLEGKWNPDLMTLLMEPTMYMIMALSEKAEIDYMLESGDAEQPKEMSPDKEINMLKGGISELDNMKKKAAQQINERVIPQEVKEMIETTEISPSLLEKVKSTPSSSLLGKGE